MPEEKSFFVETVFGAKSRQPLVRISCDGKEIALMPAEDATALAMNLLQSAQASLTDAFLVSFLEQSVNLEPAQVFGVLKEFRDWRMGREGKP
jgi:hypothetical protein